LRLKIKFYLHAREGQSISNLSQNSHIRIYLVILKHSVNRQYAKILNVRLNETTSLRYMASNDLNFSQPREVMREKQLNGKRVRNVCAYFVLTNMEILQEFRANQRTCVPSLAKFPRIGTYRFSFAKRRTIHGVELLTICDCLGIRGTNARSNCTTLETVTLSLCNEIVVASKTHF